MSERVKCPKCGRLKPEWAIKDGRCNADRMDEERGKLAALGADAKGRYVPLTWNDIRGKRANILFRCDYTQLADVKDSDRKAWAAYRQKLRDLPQTYATPEEVVWPAPPSQPAFKTEEEL